MDSVRYFAAMLIVVIAPPLYLWWLLIHPLAAFWRKIGIFTYFFMSWILLAINFNFIHGVIFGFRSH